MLKKNIFYILLILAIFFTFLNILPVRAHSPITMDMEYDLEAHELSVKITHGVTDSSYHYINNISVWVNITQMWWDDEHEEIVYSSCKEECPFNEFEPLVPLEVPNYTYYYTYQETHNINTYILPFLAGDKANITVKACCSLGILHHEDYSLTEHYYVGKPYENPHGTFSLAVAPTIISTIIVFGLLIILPMFGQKNLPKKK